MYYKIVGTDLENRHQPNIIDVNQIHGGTGNEDAKLVVHLQPPVLFIFIQKYPFKID